MHPAMAKYLIPTQSTTSTPPDGAVPVQDADPLSACIGELERGFREFRDLSFKRQMPQPVITIQTAGRKNAAGWFGKERWQNGQPKKLAEINISAEYLAEGVEDIAEVLLHEMCHYANYLDGIRDCSSSQYHNRKFRQRCDSIGLICEKGPRGWAYTRLGPDLLEIVRHVNLNPEAFQMYRSRAGEYRMVEPQPERRLRRWTCLCARSKVIYASRGLDVTCNKCLRPYQENPLA